MISSFSIKVSNSALAKTPTPTPTGCSTTVPNHILDSKYEKKICGIVYIDFDFACRLRAQAASTLSRYRRYYKVWQC